MMAEQFDTTPEVQVKTDIPALTAQVVITPTESGPEYVMVFSAQVLDQNGEVMENLTYLDDQVKAKMPAPLKAGIAAAMDWGLAKVLWHQGLGPDPDAA